MSRSITHCVNWLWMPTLSCACLAQVIQPADTRSLFCHTSCEWCRHMMWRNSCCSTVSVLSCQDSKNMREFLAWLFEKLKILVQLTPLVRNYFLVFGQYNETSILEKNGEVCLEHTMKWSRIMMVLKRKCIIFRETRFTVQSRNEHQSTAKLWRKIVMIQVHLKAKLSSRYFSASRLPYHLWYVGRN